MMNSILSYKLNPEEDFYNILGCDELSSCEQITTEYKCRARKCHPDKHPDNEDATKEFALIQKAKTVLCDPESRQCYDKWRCSGITISYKEWCAKRNSIQTSMHWAVRKKKEPMLEGPRQKTEALNNDDSDVSKWGKRSDDDVLRLFRNYDI